VRPASAHEGFQELGSTKPHLVGENIGIGHTALITPPVAKAKDPIIKGLIPSVPQYFQPTSVQPGDETEATERFLFDSLPPPPDSLEKARELIKIAKDYESR
jgi:hypothetical protein